MPEELKLTDREIAIARGLDPDSPAPGEGEEDHQGLGGKEAASPSDNWRTEEIRELAASLGWDDEKLNEFETYDQFIEAAVKHDNELKDLSEKVARESERQAPPPPPKRPEKQAETQATTDLDQIELDPEKYRAAGYDEETVNIVRYTKALHDELKRLRPAVDEMVRAYEEAKHQSYLNHFHDLLDTMDEERYGRSVDSNGRPVKLPPEKNENRRKIYDTAHTLLNGIIAKGAKPEELPPLSTLVKRAELVVFGNEILQKERENFKQRVERQARYRRPLPSRPVVNHEGRRPERLRGQGMAGLAEIVKDIANHPDVVKLWERLQEENGSR